MQFTINSEKGKKNEVRGTNIFKAPTTLSSVPGPLYVLFHLILTTAL